MADESIVAALEAVGLPHLSARLDEEADWNVLLSGGEQQRVGIARALIRKPRCCCSTNRWRRSPTTPAAISIGCCWKSCPPPSCMTIDRREVLREFHPGLIALDRADASAMPQGRPLVGPLAIQPA